MELDNLVLFWNNVITELITALRTMTDSQGKNRYLSGVTGQEITVLNTDMITKEGSKIILVLQMPPQAKFIDEGVKGWANEKTNTGRFSFKKNNPPIPTHVIRDWMFLRGIVFDKFQEVKSNKSISKLKRQEQIDNAQNQLARIIGRSIKKKGIEGVPFYSSTITEKLITEYGELVVTMLGEDLGKNIVFEVSGTDKRFTI
jgi:hypothetical protein